MTHWYFRRTLFATLGLLLTTAADASAQRMRAAPRQKPAPTQFATAGRVPIGYQVTPLSGPGAFTPPAPGAGGMGGFNPSIFGQPAPFQQGLQNASPYGSGPFNNMYQNTYFNNPFQSGASPFGNPYMNGVYPNPLYPNALNTNSPFNSSYWPTPNYPNGVLAPPVFP